MNGMYQDKQLKRDTAQSRFETNKSQNKGVYIEDNRPASFLNTAPVQGQFYLQEQDGSKTWHNEEPDTMRYEYTGRSQNATFFSYPLYRHKLLDSRAYPKSTEEDAMDDARYTGIIPNQFQGELQSVDAVLRALPSALLQQFKTAYNKLGTYTKEKDKAKIIQGALTNVRAGALFDTGNARAHDARAKVVFVNRFKLMVDYIKSVGDEVIGKGPARVKDKFWIESTGSDPHAGGKHALFLVNKTNPNEKQLYKAHSLKFENAFVGANGIISSVNNRFKKKDRLPTMGINPKAHTEEFVDRVGDKYDQNYTDDMHKEHSEKLGQLETISHVFGVTDLHAENVLFGKSGPVPIDSEVGAGYPDETGIDDPFGPGMVDDEMIMTTPSSLYVNGEQEKINQDKFAAGKGKATRVLKQHKKSLLKQWRKQLRNVDSFRVVPIATNVLAGAVSQALNPGNQANVEQTFRTEMNDFITTNELAKHLKLKVVKRGAVRFWNIVREGTLPAFEFKMKTGQLLMDGDIVANPQVSDVTAETSVLKLSELAKGRIDNLP